MNVCLRVFLISLVAALPLPAEAQIKGEIQGTYVGLFGFWGRDNLRAQLVVPKAGKRFKGVISFWSFVGETGLERGEYSFEVNGTFDERFDTVTLRLSKWIRVPEHGDYGMNYKPGKLDPYRQLLVGDAFEFARVGTADAERLARLQDLFELQATQQRTALEAHRAQPQAVAR